MSQKKETIFKMANLSNCSSVLSSNFSTVSSTLPCSTIVFDDEYSANLGTSHYLPLTIAFIIIAVTTVVSNGAFMLVVFRSRRLQTLHNILIISLSITDLFTGVVVTPIYPISYIFMMSKRYPSCVLLWFRLISFNAVSIISFITLAFISFEKYLAIIHTYFYQRVITKRKVIVTALAVWIFGTTFSVSSNLIGLSYPKVRDSI